MADSPVLKRLTLDSSLKPFDCNDSDLNDFFHNDALDYLQQLLAVTYVLENKKETIAYFSILNDKIDNRNPKIMPGVFVSKNTLAIQLLTE